jgi:hypothetical protein
MMLLPKPLLLRRDHQQGYKPLPDKPLEEEEGISNIFFLKFLFGDD